MKLPVTIRRIGNDELSNPTTEEMEVEAIVKTLDNNRLVLIIDDGEKFSATCHITGYSIHRGESIDAVLDWLNQVFPSFSEKLQKKREEILETCDPLNRYLSKEAFI